MGRGGAAEGIASRCGVVCEKGVGVVMLSIANDNDHVALSTEGHQFPL